MLSARDLFALAAAARELTQRHSPVSDRVRSLFEVANAELERAGGVAGIRSEVRDLLEPARPGSAGPAAATPEPRTGPAPLRGTGISGGTASGFARRVVGAESCGEVAAGEIVVCATLAPEWAPVLDRAAGLVVETGSASMSAARSARQRGVPMVRLAEAMTRLDEGAELAVDGDTGTVAVGQGG